MIEKFTLPDVSFWQDKPDTSLGIDFEKMKSKTSAVIIRAGQNLWVDNEFKISWENSRKAGLYRGSYWFYDSRAHPKRQAELWVNTLAFDTGELPLWCDFEDNYGGQFNGWRYWYDFMVRLKELLPHKQLGIYTGYYYWIENTRNMPDESGKFFAKHPLWIAWYNPTQPRIPPIWDDWIYWQYTDNGDGTLYGVESKNIDLNYFNGTEEKFMEYFNLKPLKSNNKIVTANFNGKLAEYKEKI